MSGRQSLIHELEDAIACGSQSRRAATLRRVTDLLAGRADDYDDEQIDVFDDVILRLAREIETKARAELARRLARLERAPKNIVRDLANDDAIEVAAPILLHSPRLADEDLVDIARRKDQTHLLAIASRRRLAHVVTDVLVERGDDDVLFNVASNTNARFSENGYALLVERAVGDDSLTSRVGERPDIRGISFANC